MMTVSEDSWASVAYLPTAKHVTLKWLCSESHNLAYEISVEFSCKPPMVHQIKLNIWITASVVTHLLCDDTCFFKKQKQKRQISVWLVNCTEHMP